MMAAGRNQMEFACMLLENGADPMIKDQGGSVAYQNADDPELRELLGGPSATMVNAVFLSVSCSLSSLSISFCKEGVGGGTCGGSDK